jgi:hypothetical protein
VHDIVHRKAAGESERCSCGLAMVSRIGHAYNEEAFRYLLAVQRKRSERSGRPFLLLLVSLHDPTGADGVFPRPVAQELFSAMCRAFRETDFMGWYREQRVAGAVLTELEGTSQDDVSDLIVARASERLVEALPPFISSRLQIHICQIQPTLTP